MTQNSSKQQFIHSLSLTVALGALVGLGGTAAHAGFTTFDPINGSTALLPGTVTTTAQYQLGDFGKNHEQDFGSPYPVALGSNTATFIATGEPTSPTAFEGFRNQVVGSTGTSFDFPLNTHLIDTFDPFSQSPTGPLEIDFSAPVGSFGFNSQSSRAPDLEQFTFSVFDSSNNLLGGLTTQFIPNSTGNGKSVFIGAEFYERQHFQSRHQRHLQCQRLFWRQRGLLHRAGQCRRSGAGSLH